MYDVTTIVANMVVNAVSLVNIVVLTKILYNIRFSISKLLLYTISVSIIDTSIAYIVSGYGQGLKMILTFTATCFLLKLFYRLTLAQSLVSTGLFLILQAFGNIVAYFTLRVLKYENIFSEDLKVLIVANIIINVVIVAVLIVIRQFKLFSRFPQEVRTKAYISNAIYIVIIILIIAANMSYYYNSNITLKDTGILLMAVLLLGCLIYGIINTNTRFNLEAKSQQLQYQIFYNKTLDMLIGDLTRFKHNYKNILNVLYAYIKMEKWDELSEYMKEVIGESGKLDEINSMMVLNIKNAGILGLITYKMEYAAKSDVGFRININGEIRDVNMKISELCEVLGVLLDNAIESASLSDEKRVDFHIQKSGRQVVFTIENSYNGKIEIGRIFHKGYSTKGTGRGLGLWIVAKLIDKYDNVLLNTLTENKVFKQELVVS